MKNNIKYVSLLLVVLSANSLEAQTVNTGELSISPNTIFTVMDDLDNGPNALFINDGELHLKQNINNDGTFNQTFGLNTGQINIDGFVAQSITGGTPLIVNDVNLDNTSGIIELANTLRINGSTEFNSGILNVNPTSGVLYFEKDATHQLAWDESHVEGVQYKNGEDSFIFPSGENGLYRPAFISAPDVETDRFSCVYRQQNSDLIFAHSSFTGVIERINDTEYWELNRDNGASDVIVGLSYEPGVTPSFITNNLERVHVVRWDETFNAWVSEGGVHDAQASMIYTVARVNGYGLYTLAVVDADAIAGEEVVVYNLVTPNGNGENDWMVFDGLENFDDNKVVIVNRWGEAVFEMDGYDNLSNVFKGYANKGITNTNAPLPDGTYYYVITYTNNAGEATKKVGYLHLAGN